MNYTLIISIILIIVTAIFIAFLILNRKKIKIKILEEKAEKGSVEAQLALGVIYLSGIDIKKDKVKGKKYIEMASINGSAPAQYMYGGLLLEDDKLSNDKLIESASWIKKSADNGYLKAVTTLAEMYAEGKIYKQNTELALHYYEMASKMGDVTSQVTTAGIYDFSFNSDKIKAFAWYKTASFQGSEYASEMAEKLYNLMDENQKQTASKLAEEYISKYIKKIKG